MISAAYPMPHQGDLPAFCFGSRADLLGGGGDFDDIRDGQKIMGMDLRTGTKGVAAALRNEIEKNAA